MKDVKTYKPMYLRKGKPLWWYHGSSLEGLPGFKKVCTTEDSGLNTAQRTSVTIKKVVYNTCCVV